MEMGFNVIILIIIIISYCCGSFMTTQIESKNSKMLKMNERKFDRLLPTF